MNKRRQVRNRRESEFRNLVPINVDLCLIINGHEASRKIGKQRQNTCTFIVILVVDGKSY